MSKTATLSKIVALEEELKKLKEDLIENQKYKLKGGEYYIHFEGKVGVRCTSDGARKFGVEFETRTLALQAIKHYKLNQVIYKIAEDLNEGWKPDWNDDHHSKYTIRCHIDGYNQKIYKVYSTDLVSICGVTYFKSADVAKEAISILKQLKLI